MKFNGFLISVARAYCCEGARELFHLLGGEEVLGIKFRTFRAIFAGSLRPSDRFLVALFQLVPDHLKKECLIHFFMDLDPVGSISEFLNINLSVGVTKKSEAIWTRRKHVTLTRFQLKILSRDQDYIRMYNRLACHSPVSLSGCLNRELEILEDFVRIGLATKKKDKWLQASPYFRLPHPDYSSPKDVDAANHFIVRHVPTFLASATTRSEQEIGYSFHTCLRSDAEKIIAEMKNFKKWVQSFALSEDHPSEVTLLWFDFARLLRVGEDY